MAAVYYYLLLNILGWLMAQHWPAWWLWTFPSRHSGLTAWILTLHALGVLTAALPLAFICIILLRPYAILLGASAGVLAALAAVIPGIVGGLFPLMWDSHPISFVTDQVELLFAIPVLAWVAGKLLFKTS
jgi:hypothetical protein